MRVVIMGGTSGIGLATAERLTADGAEVIVTGQDPERLAAVQKKVAGAEQVDGVSEGDVTEFFERIGSFEHLVLAFSPGALGQGPVAGVSLAYLKGAFEGKLFPYLFAIQKAQVTSSITVVSAATARTAAPGTVTFAAVNGAIERIVPPLAAELAPCGSTPWGRVPSTRRGGRSCRTRRARSSSTRPRGSSRPGGSAGRRTWRRRSPMSSARRM
jgi:NAD(P)-dependent dehydrogenase (short-subunit alcohol dehydrogenase family)